MIESPPSDVPPGSPDAPSTNSVLNILRRALRFCKYDTNMIIGKPVLKIWIFRWLIYLRNCCQTWYDGETGTIFLLARKNGGKVKGLRNIFLILKKSRSRFPVFFIFFCISVTLTCGLGLLTFREEAEMTALWVPRWHSPVLSLIKTLASYWLNSRSPDLNIVSYYRGAKFREDFEWVQENFPKQLR